MRGAVGADGQSALIAGIHREQQGRAATSTTVLALIAAQIEAAARETVR
jgi:hypothetical protein